MYKTTQAPVLLQTAWKLCTARPDEMAKSFFFLSETRSTTENTNPFFFFGSTASQNCMFTYGSSSGYFGFLSKGLVAYHRNNAVNALL